MKYTLILSLVYLTIYKAPVSKNYSSQLKNNFSLINLDTSRYVIIPFNKDDDKYLFDKDAQPTTLSLQEIKTVENLLMKKITAYNKKEKRNSPWIIKYPKNYYTQLIAAINTKGEKIVWVNCFCDKSDLPYWKKSIIKVLDGGPCFFNVKINLATNTVYDFGVNGVG